MRGATRAFHGVRDGPILLSIHEARYSARAPRVLPSTAHGMPWSTFWSGTHQYTGWQLFAYVPYVLGDASMPN